MLALFLAIVLLWCAVFLVVFALCVAAQTADKPASQLRGFEASKLKETNAPLLHERLR